MHLARLLLENWLCYILVRSSDAGCVNSLELMDSCVYTKRAMQQGEASAEAAVSEHHRHSLEIMCTLAEDEEDDEEAGLCVCVCVCVCVRARAQVRLPVSSSLNHWCVHGCRLATT